MSKHERKAHQKRARTNARKLLEHGEKFARTMANEARMRQHAEEKGIPPLLAFVAGVMFGDEDQRDAAQLGLAMVIGASLAKHVQVPAGGDLNEKLDAQRAERRAEQHARRPEPLSILCVVCGHREGEHAAQAFGGDAGRRYDPPRCTVEGFSCGRFSS
jgi:hypothetical protein